jgi:dTDP-glucose 4,6-dehydratase
MSNSEFQAADASPSASILVTGGAGFIGSNFVHCCISKYGASLINVDKLTYAGNIRNLSTIEAHPKYSFIQADINDQAMIGDILKKRRPRAIVHFAA